MLKGESSILIDRPPDDVWKFMADLRNTSKWDPGVLEIRQISEGALGLGGAMEVVDNFLGRRMIVNVLITEWEENETAAWTLNAAFAHGLARYHIEPAGKGSRLTRRVEIEFKGLYRLLEPFLNFSGKIGRRTERHEELVKVKRLIEAGA